METLMNRAKQIVLQPKETWNVIASEETTVSKLLTSYVLPLALIPAIASFIGFGIIGFSAGYFGRAASLEWGINQAVTSFIGTFLGIWVSAWVISQLAPKYGVTLSMSDAVKLVAYSYTPSMLAGIFYLIPALTILVIVGSIYSLYVLYLGFQPITKVNSEQQTSYFVISLIAIIIVFVAISFVLGIILTTIGLAGYQKVVY